MAAPLRVLCLDIEGGHGGSSRSLYEVLRHMDRNEVEAEVWCRRDGPVRARYEALGIPCRIVSNMPKVNTLARRSRNLHAQVLFARDFMASAALRRDLAQAAAARFDVVHFNHEGLYWLAAWLRGRHRNAQTMHVRTMIPNNLFGRAQVKLMAWTNHRFVFITENEKGNIERLAGGPLKGAVIYNPVTPLPAAPAESRRGLVVSVLSNYAWIRGVDRTVGIAEALSARGRREISFVVAGDMRLTGALPGGLAEFKGRTLADYARARGVDAMFKFLGHVPDPDRVLAGSDVLLKMTRAFNPWGRDILEALAAGKPVISVGSYDRFIRDGETGFLLPDYDAGKVADILIRLADTPGLARTMGEAGRRHVAALCDGPSRARDLVELWRGAVTARPAS